MLPLVHHSVRDFLAPLPDPAAGRRPHLWAPELWERMHPDDVKYAVRQGVREYASEWAALGAKLLGEPREQRADGRPADGKGGLAAPGASPPLHVGTDAGASPPPPLTADDIRGVLLTYGACAAVPRACVAAGETRFQRRAPEASWRCSRRENGIYPRWHASGVGCNYASHRRRFS